MRRPYVDDLKSLGDKLQCLARDLQRRPVLGTPELRRRVLHGDWHPLLRDPIDVLRLNFVAGAIVMFSLGDIHAAMQLVFSAVAVLLVRAADPPRRFDFAFIVAMTLNGWGDALGLFNSISWYDNLVHITLPLAVGPIAYLALFRLDVVPAFTAENTHRHRLGMGIIAMALGVFAACVYEIYEWFVDTVFGAHLFISESDTVNDLADGILGAAVGGLLLAALARTNTPVLRLPLGGRGRGRTQRAAYEQAEAEERGHPGADQCHERPGLRGSTAQRSVEDHPRGGTDRGTESEAAGAQTRGSTAVVEGGDRHARSHPQQRNAPHATGLDPGDHARKALGQTLEQPRPEDETTESEGGEGAERTAEQRHRDPQRAQEQSADRAQQRARDQQRRTDDPDGEEQEGRPGADRLAERSQGLEVVRDQHDQRGGRRREHDAEQDT